MNRVGIDSYVKERILELMTASQETEKRQLPINSRSGITDTNMELIAQQQAKSDNSITRRQPRQLPWKLHTILKAFSLEDTSRAQGT